MRDVTVYSIEENIRMVEIHPHGTKNAGEEIFKDIHWSHLLNIKGLLRLSQTLPELQDKRVFLMVHTQGEGVIAGFYPKLSAEEEATLTGQLQQDKAPIETSKQSAGDS